MRLNLHPLFAATLNHLFTLENARLSGRFRVPGKVEKNKWGRLPTDPRHPENPRSQNRSFYPHVTKV
jgi:hypothetical protein